MRSAQYLAGQIIASRSPQVPFNVVELIRDAGIALYFCPFPDEVSGVYTAHFGIPAIGINSTHPRVRQRFTMAHEFYHHIMPGPNGVSLSAESAKLYERRADKFAVELLMPRNLFTTVYAVASSIVDVAHVFDVSVQTATIRAAELGLVRYCTGGISA